MATPTPPAKCQSCNTLTNGIHPINKLPRCILCEMKARKARNGKPS